LLHATLDQQARADPSPAAFYRPALDGLRFFAFVAVFLHHLFPYDPAIYRLMGAAEGPAQWMGALALSGATGVDLFFCLSAYLITELLLREHEARGSVDVRAFWIRRALRIWPLYYFFVALSALVLPQVSAELSQPLTSAQLLSFLFFFSNWHFAVHGYADTAAALLWSVAIEEQFYVVWPLVIRLASPPRLPAVFAALLVVGPATRAYLATGGIPHPGIWCNTFARLDPIALGGILALAFHRRPFTLSRAKRAALVAAGVLGIVATVRLVPLATNPPRLALAGAYSVVALCTGLILVAALGAQEGTWLSARPIVYLGRISYGLYVFHQLALRLVGLPLGIFRSMPGPGTTLGWIVGSFGLTVVMAAVSYRLLEKPFLRLKTRFAFVASRPE
jgi:peptidoglycan/LPS O-acetylase OafA/YrhL